jgi:hypothetical protein
MAAASSALSLDTLPFGALTHVLASPALAVADLARVACASKQLWDAATHRELPQWRRVRVVGSLRYKLNEETFKARNCVCTGCARETLAQSLCDAPESTADACAATREC